MKYKFPHTLHFPWSEGLQNDDKMIKSTAGFFKQRVIITEKVDGENTSMYRDHIHARSIDSKDHKSRNWVKRYWDTIKHEIPDNWRICGENMYATHSIHYDDLPSYFLGFSIWNEKNYCLAWDDTLELFNLLGIEPVPVIYDGIYDEKMLEKYIIPDGQEGYVCRIADKIHYNKYDNFVAKVVRKNHIQTDEHWMNKEIIPNKLKIASNIVGM